MMKNVQLFMKINAKQVNLLELFFAFYSGGFLQRQKVITSYHVKKFIKESQFLLFSRQKVY